MHNLGEDCLTLVHPIMALPTKQNNIVLLHVLHALLTVTSLSAIVILFGQLTQQFPGIVPISSPNAVTGNTLSSPLPTCNLSDRRPGCG